MPSHYSLTPQQRIQQIMSLTGQYQGQLPGMNIPTEFTQLPLSAQGSPLPLPGMQQAAQPPFPQGMGLRSAQSITGGAPQGQGPLPNFGQSAQGNVPFGANAQAGAPQMDVANMIQSIDQFPTMPGASMQPPGPAMGFPGISATPGQRSGFSSNPQAMPDFDVAAALRLTDQSTPDTPFTRQDMRAASRARIARGRTPADRARNLESARRRRELQRIQVQTGRGRFDRAGNFIDEGGKLPWERGPDIAERFDDLKIVPQADRMAIIENDPELKTEMFRRMGAARTEQADTLRQQRLATIDTTNTRGEAIRERRIASGQLRQNQPRTISPENVAIQAAVKSRRAVQKERSQSLVQQNAQLRRAAQQARLGQPFMLPEGVDAGGGVPPGLWQTNPQLAVALTLGNQQNARLTAAEKARNRLTGRELDIRQSQATARAGEFRTQETRLSRTGDDLARFRRGELDLRGQAQLQSSMQFAADQARRSSEAARASGDARSALDFDRRFKAFDALGSALALPPGSARNKATAAWKSTFGNTIDVDLGGNQEGALSSPAEARETLGETFEDFADTGSGIAPDTGSAGFASGSRGAVDFGSMQEVANQLIDGHNSGVVTADTLPQIVTAIQSRGNRETWNLIKANKQPVDSSGKTVDVSAASRSAWKIFHDLLNGRGSGSLFTGDNRPLRRVNRR